MKRIVIALLVVVSGFYSCQQGTEKGGFTINGNLEGLNDSAFVYLRYRVKDSVHIDSSLVSSGQFNFKGTVTEPVIALFYEAGLRHYTRFYLENSDIHITGNADSLDQAKITGSAAQEDYEALNKQKETVSQRQEELYKAYGKARDNNDEKTMQNIETQLDSLSKESHKVSIDFIQKHPKSYVSLGALSQLVYSTDYKELKSLFDGLDSSVQQSKTGQKMAKHLEIMAKTAIGQPAPAFSQDDSTGHTVSLSDFKGKYVLIDFWASWCGPCRAENPNVVKAYNKYKDKDFTILGVSLDESRADWLKAIHHDGLVWTQVSDLKGWKNSVATQYGVRAIPANFLLNPDGVIIGHNLRGEKLEDKLKAVLMN